MRKFRDLDNGHYFIWNGTLPKSTKRKDPGVCKKLTARTFQSETDQVFKLTPEEVELEADRQAKPRVAT